MAEDWLEQHAAKERRECIARLARSYPDAEVEETSMRIEVDGEVVHVEVRVDWDDRSAHARYMGHSIPSFWLSVGRGASRADGDRRSDSAAHLGRDELEGLVARALQQKTSKPAPSSAKGVSPPLAPARVTRDKRPDRENRKLLGFAVAFLVVCITVLILGPGSCLLGWVRWLFE